MKIVIIGGGASGLLVASILKNNNVDADIEIVEKYEHVGKKLLLTGNGRCNLTNINIQPKDYNNDFGYQIASSFNARQYFESIGLLTCTDNEGRVYPYSLVSNSVLDVIRQSLEDVNIHSSTNIIRIIKKDNVFKLTSDSNKTFEADIVVLATGGKTYYKDTNSYILASMLSHRVSQLRPSLSSLKVEENLASIENLRCKVVAKLISNNKEVYVDEGEVLFKKDALSGIVIFQLSSIIARNIHQKYEIQLDLMPNYSLQEVENIISNYPSMIGMFPKMINQYVIKKSIDTTPKNIAYTIKHLTFNVLENIDFKVAQVTSGGVSINELKEDLESKLIDNLYFAGEIIDVDGLCGGYNLQFAFASANSVAQSIIKKVGNNNEK